MQQRRILKLLVTIFMSIIYVIPQTSAQNVTDLLTPDIVEKTDQTISYTDFSEIKIISEAIYAGNIGLAKNLNYAITLRTSNNSGIVTTTSGGLAKRIIIYWNPEYKTSTQNILNVYGKSEPYSSAADLYKTTNVNYTIKRSSTNIDTLDIDTDFQYFGIRANNANAYLDSIAIVWSSDIYSKIQSPTFTPAAGTYNSTQNVTIDAADGHSVYYTIDGSIPTVGNGIRYADGNSVCVDRNMTIKAIAVDEESYAESDVATAEYIIKRLFQFDADATTATLGSEFVGPALTNTYVDGSVTWTSSDNDVATVDNNGYVTLLRQGYTVITATLSLPDNMQLTAAYRLAINDPTILPVGSAYFRRVTSNDEIVDGGIYIIVNEDYKKAMGALNSSNYGTAVAVTTSQNIIKDFPTGAEFTFTKKNDGWSLKNNTGYIGCKDGTSFNISTEPFQWTIDVARPDSVAISNGSNRLIRYISATNEFRAYIALKNTSTISLYRKMGALKITNGGRDADGRYYATYFTDMAIVVPETVTFTTVGVSDNRMVLADYTINEIIPASTGLVVSAAEPGIYEYPVSGKSATTSDRHAGNLLKGDIKDVTAEDMAADGADYTFFRLAKPAGEELGFWWGAPEGKGFAIGAYKAYLSVPESISAAKGFSFDSAVSSIKAINNRSTALKKDVIYNLNGQRISKITGPGIYIMGGKRVVIKKQ